MEKAVAFKTLHAPRAVSRRDGVFANRGRHRPPLVHSIGSLTPARGHSRQGGSRKIRVQEKGNVPFCASLSENHGTSKTAYKECPLRQYAEILTLRTKKRACFQTRPQCNRGSRERKASQIRNSPAAFNSPGMVKAYSPRSSITRLKSPP